MALLVTTSFFICLINRKKHIRASETSTEYSILPNSETAVFLDENDDIDENLPIIGRHN